MNKYTILELIGEGVNGEVFKIRKKSNKKIFACKEINYGRMNEKEKQ
jgi:NIMA (never in mitosis gene a)-related kinase